MGHKALRPLYISRGHGNGAGPLLVLLTRMAREGQHGPGDSGMKMSLNEYGAELNCCGKPAVSPFQPIQIILIIVYKTGMMSQVYSAP